jgi:hypothetical protein
MAVYTATFEGQTVTRVSVKPYTHASVVRWSNAETGIVSFHAREAAALKGVLTGQQRGNGASVVAVVPAVAVICDYCDQPATRVGDGGEPLCKPHASESYGSDWRTLTTQLTARKAARFGASGNCNY